MLHLDGYLRPETICYEFVRALEQLAPFGQGFQYPTFAARDLRLVDSRTVGAAGQHWKARLRPAANAAWDAIYFDAGHLAERFKVGDRLDAAFKLKRSQFEGFWRLELELVDVAPVS